jgi:hypothetical protein
VSLEDTIRKEKHIYEKSKGRIVFQKDWSEKMKGMRSQRKKFFKPPLFKNKSQENQQGQSTQNHLRIVGSSEKIPRK